MLLIKLNELNDEFSSRELNPTFRLSLLTPRASLESDLNMLCWRKEE